MQLNKYVTHHLNTLFPQRNIGLRSICINPTYVSPLYLIQCRFQHDKDKTVETANNMRKLLAVHLKNLPLKHKLATELGLSDVLQSMSSYDSGYLSDLAKL